jgi:prepilin-type N-terminal cleavage/methylation domain-containing protein
MRTGFTLIELMIVIAIIAIIAAIAIPNLMESRISSNEAAAASSLKSGVFPAETQFQSGNYVDNGGPAGLGADQIGDFCSWYPSMAGSTGGSGTNLPSVPLSLLPALWDVDHPIINGYSYEVASNYEMAFCAACYPQDQGSGIGRRCFAINTSGYVYATAAATTNPQTLLGASLLSPTLPFGTSYTMSASNWSIYRR